MTSGTKKFENKKESWPNYQEYLFRSILNISRRSGYRVLGPNLAQTGSATLIKTYDIWVKGTLENELDFEKEAANSQRCAAELEGRCIFFHFNPPPRGRKKYERLVGWGKNMMIY